MEKKCEWHDKGKCVGCPIYEKEKEKALRVNNDPFDAAVDMWWFTDECQKNGGVYHPYNNELVSYPSFKK